MRHLVDRKAWDPRWQEVIALLAGQLGDPEPLIQLLEHEKKDDLFRHRLALAASCLPELKPEIRIRNPKSLTTSPLPPSPSGVNTVRTAPALPCRI